MPRAVRFERYGGVEVLDVVDVEAPTPAEGQWLVRVRAAGIHPFEAKLRRGVFEGQLPVSFPAAQGNDVAGVVEALGPGVSAFKPGDEVLGTTVRRGSQAELALVSAEVALRRPPAVSWEVAGGLWTVATTAHAAVGAVAPGPGDVVVVAGAGGGVGERSQAWLRSRGITPVVYGEGLEQRLRGVASELGGAPAALIDTAGHGYVELAVRLGIAPARIDTIVDFEAAARHGARTDGGGESRGRAAVAEIVELLAAGALELPIAATFPLERVRDAYTLLETGHPPGKIVLVP